MWEPGCWRVWEGATGVGKPPDTNSPNMRAHTPKPAVALGLLRVRAIAHISLLSTTTTSSYSTSK
jgi:hypothetical protein